LSYTLQYRASVKRDMRRLKLRFCGLVDKGLFASLNDGGKYRMGHSAATFHDAVLIQKHRP
jgi:hypothetical protein